jgi:hypothetical protein
MAIQPVPIYQTPQQWELATKYNSGEDKIRLNPWTVQNIVYELVINHLANNTPRSLGFPFDQVYNPDRTKSDYFIDLGFNWDAATVQKRPAAFITRGKCKYDAPYFKGQLGQGNMKESDDAKTVMAGMGVAIKCIATNVGFAEQWAEFVKIGIMHHQWTIQRDYGFRKFRLHSVSEPSILIESKEHFNVVLEIETEFVEGWIVHGDDLKLKTVSKIIYDGMTGRILSDEQ